MSHLLLFLCLLSGLSLSLGVKSTFFYQNSGVFGSYLHQDFGMAVGGVIDVDYNVYPQDSSAPFESYMLLLVITHSQGSSWYSELQDGDLPISQNINNLCNEPSMFRKTIFGSGSAQFNIDYNVGVGQYSVVLLQCRQGNVNNPVNADITLYMKNPRPHSNEYSHYGIEDVMQVRVLEGEMIIYALLVLGMCGQLFLAR